MDFTLEVKLPAECIEKLIALSKEQQLSPEAIIRRAINSYALPQKQVIISTDPDPDGTSWIRDAFKLKDDGNK